MFLTFIAAMDRSRDATSLWRAGVVLFGSEPAVFDANRAADLATAGHSKNRNDGKNPRSRRLTRRPEAWFWSPMTFVKTAVDTDVGQHIIGACSPASDSPLPLDPAGGGGWRP